MKVLFIAIFTLGLFYAANLYADSSTLAKSKIKNSSGEVVGFATFIENSQGVSISVQVQNLTTGSHGIHIHQKGRCEAPDFKSAGGHFNPFGKSHGTKNPEGYHLGDLGNIQIGPDGTGSLLVNSPLSTLGDGKNSLLKKDGTSIVIHSGPDDLVSDPSGNAGSRVACGIIRKLK
ncbi:MAG: superoxide dismutase family protein [Candidatus Dadabacteria bacterium]|nr:superoxide dismutase family protein [Candidatus Dadabacteria bacterium]NIS08419.1 superoxide dismutase family protein [Candidatus Dadabacteria bacterium]NIV41984.1 superoxide dismutase family protein [Candidatus Dadabacteria bacterium]NIX15290.1 superoxide dismutase family protein [Candidatus Dadabacteria bacterium]NIY21907.1 superoxide dismutase family protein [Candidatus Dadabacteria bacterium]